MSDDRPEPRVFANKVLNILIRNSSGEEFVLTRDDYMALRVVFRRCGGSWGQISSGNQNHVGLLQEIVKAWCTMPERERQLEQLV